MNANLLLQDEKFDDAEILFKIALKKTDQKDSIHLSSLMGLHSVYSHQKKSEEASKVLNNAIELSSKKKEWRQFYKQLCNIKERTTLSKDNITKA